MAGGEPGNGGRIARTITDTDGHVLHDEVAEPVDEPLAAGVRVGRYLIVRQVGRGGFGVVYEAHDPDLDRRVAIKVLRSTRARGPSAHERLLREAQALARLSHPNVVTVHDVGTVAGGLFVAMELVDGETLATWLARAHRLDELLDAFVAAGRGLAAAHSAGIVHRDFKPANVLMGKNGQVRVADFGLARSQDDDDGPVGPSPLSAGRPEVTRAGAVLGTPAYMAPEQGRGERVDARSDQYSFAATLFEALEGRRPGAPPPSGPRVELPPWLRRVVDRGLAARRDDRYPDMDALLADLERGRGTRRRRGIAAGLAALAVVSVALLVLGWRASHASSACQGFDRHLVGVWDDAVRARTRAAFAATGKVFATDAFQHAAARLDAHARAWVDMREDACLATRVRGEQSEALLDLRMACLDRRLGQLAALTTLLGSADGDVVTEAVGAVARLDPLAGCADAAALTAQTPRPDDPALEPRIAAVQTRLDRARALLDGGKLDDALALVRPAETDAVAIGWPGLSAQAFYLHGEVERQRGSDAKQADGPLAEAARQAALARDDVLQARALMALAFRADEAGDATRALALVDAAESVVARAGGDELLRSEWRAMRGGVLERLGRYDEARAEYTQALEVRERRLGPDHPDVAETLTSMSTVARMQSKFDESRAQLVRALAIWRAAYGSEHPNVAITLNNLGSLELDAGNLEAAERAYAEALALKQKIFGAETLTVATTLMNLGNVASMRGQRDQADVYLDRALALRRKQLPADNPLVLESLYNLAILRRQQGRLDEALALHRQVLAGREKLYGPEHDRVANSIEAIATVLEQSGKLDQALVERRRVLVIREKLFGPGHADVARSLSGIAGTLESLARCDEAIPLAERAVAIYEALALGKSYDIVPPLENLGLCELRQGRAAPAAGHFERALVAAGTAGAGPDEQAAVRFEWARALWGKGERPRARREAEQALHDTGGADDEMVAWLRTHR